MPLQALLIGNYLLVFSRTRSAGGGAPADRDHVTAARGELPSPGFAYAFQSATWPSSTELK
jgi:hypothetical protein